MGVVLGGDRGAVAALGLQLVVRRTGLRFRVALRRCRLRPPDAVGAALGDGAAVGGAERSDAHRWGLQPVRHRAGREVSLRVVVGLSWRLSAPGRVA
jgi:hypothetical protein